MAIGKEGQNARLAARLTGYKIDIKSESQARELGLFEDLQFEEEYEGYEEYEEEPEEYNSQEDAVEDNSSEDETSWEEENFQGQQEEN